MIFESKILESFFILIFNLEVEGKSEEFMVSLPLFQNTYFVTVNDSIVLDLYEIFNPSICCVKSFIKRLLLY